MLPVYICDDVQEELYHIKDIIEKYILISDLDMEVVCATQNPHALLNHLKEHPTISLYFLDLDLKNNDYNGLTLANEIRKYDSRGFIVIVTTHDEMIYDTFRYKIEAMDFIVKDDIANLKNRIVECLDEAFTLYISSHNTSDEKILSLKIGGSIITYKMNEIYCIETRFESHRIQILTQNSCRVITMSLNNIIKSLDDNFYRCHKSCIVNMDYIQKIERYEVTLNNGHTCPVSMKSYKDFYKKYEEFLKEYREK